MANSLHHESRQVLASVDLLGLSQQVLDAALDVAEERGCGILALHVVHESEESTGFYRRENTGNPTTPSVVVAETLMRKLVEKTLAMRRGTRVQVETRVVEGIPANRIVEVADQVDACAIVMASHGRHGISKLWHGSVTARVNQLSHRELLVFEAEAQTRRPVAPLAGATDQVSVISP